MKENLLVRGITIIERLASDGSQSVEVLFQNTNIPRSSIYRILCTLESMDYVSRFREGAEDIWELQFKILGITSNLLSRIDLKTKLRDILLKLADDTKEIVQLGIIQFDKVMFVDVIKRHKSIVNVANIGESVDINVCAAGLAICAFLDPKELDKILNNIQLQKHTEYTIDNPTEFKNLLSKIHKTGYSLDDQYFAIGHRCIGAPVFDYTGKVIASINISGHIRTITDDRVDHLASLVKKSAQESSHRMGYKDN